MWVCMCQDDMSRLKLFCCGIFNPKLWSLNVECEQVGLRGGLRFLKASIFKARRHIAVVAFLRSTTTAADKRVLTSWRCGNVLGGSSLGFAFVVCSIVAVLVLVHWPPVCVALLRFLVPQITAAGQRLDVTVSTAVAKRLGRRGRRTAGVGPSGGTAVAVRISTVAATTGRRSVHVPGFRLITKKEKQDV